MLSGTAVEVTTYFIRDLDLLSAIQFRMNPVYSPTSETILNSLTVARISQGN